MSELRKHFEERVDRSSGPDACWPWTGSVAANGYGRYNRTWAHRLAYELLVGPIPNGLQIDHLCRNRICVNPSHLEPVTREENVKRGMSPRIVLWRTDTCGRGHALTPENTYRRPDTGRRTCRTCAAIREQRRAS